MLHGRDSHLGLPSSPIRAGAQQVIASMDGQIDSSMDGQIDSSMDPVTEARKDQSQISQYFSLPQAMMAVSPIFWLPRLSTCTAGQIGQEVILRKTIRCLALARSG